MPKGIYKRKPRPSTYSLKKRLHCRKCHYVWFYTGITSSTKCPLCQHRVDARDKTDYSKKYIQLHPERELKLKQWMASSQGREIQAKTQLNEKLRVFAIISKSTHPSCANCNCDDIRILEVNHKNGGGGKEYHQLPNPSNLYRDIAMLRRPVDDLEILCRVCNAKHYLELKYGKLPITVIWGNYGI
jgi:hypothetical protein